MSSILGAWLPSRAASRLNPILALHNIETRQQENVLGKPRMFTGLAMILLGWALIAFGPTSVGLSYQFSYSALVIFGMVLLLPKLAELTARVLRPLMDKFFGSEGVIAVDTMIQSPRRTSATVGALMIGLSFVFSVGAYVRSYQTTVGDWMNRILNADIIINTSENARSRTYHFSEDLGNKLAQLPGVQRIENIRFLFLPYADDSVALVALDMGGWFARVSDVVEGADENAVKDKIIRGEGVLVARNFVARYKLGVGDRLKFQTPTGTFDFPILGVIEDYTSEKGAVFFDRELYKRYWNDPAVDIIDLIAKKGADVAALRHRPRLAGLDDGVSGKCEFSHCWACR